MPTLAQWSLAAAYGFANNSDDQPNVDDLDSWHASLDEAFGRYVSALFSKYKIDDTAENRALVYLLAVAATGGNRQMLEHGCKLYTCIVGLEGTRW